MFAFKFVFSRGKGQKNRWQKSDDRNEHEIQKGVMRRGKWSGTIKAALSCGKATLNVGSQFHLRKVNDTIPTRCDMDN